MVTSKEPEAFVFSMLTAQDDSQLPFLLSRYISIFAYDSEEYGAFLAFNNNYEDYYFSQCGKLVLAWVRLPNCAAGNGVAPNTIKTLLDDNQYVLGVWNEQYIKDTPAYCKNYCKADFMLYGYDQEDFYSVGWRDGFKTFIVKQDELEKALYLRDLNINMFWGTVLLDAGLGFDINNVKKELREFINADKLNNDGYAFGYKSIEYLAKDLVRRKKDLSCYRELAFIWEYTRLMRIRIEYMKNTGLPINQDMCEKAYIIERNTGELFECNPHTDIQHIFKRLMDTSAGECFLAEKLLSTLNEVN